MKETGRRKPWNERKRGSLTIQTTLKTFIFPMLVLLSSVCQVIIFICLSSNYIDIQGTYSFYTSPALIRYIWYSKIPQSHYIDEIKNKQLLNFYLILNSLETMISDWQVDKNGGFPGGQMVKTLPSNTGGVVRELRAHIPHHQKKKKKKECNQTTDAIL